MHLFGVKLEAQNSVEVDCFFILCIYMIYIIYACVIPILYISILHITCCAAKVFLKQPAVVFYAQCLAEGGGT